MATWFDKLGNWFTNQYNGIKSVFDYAASTKYKDSDSNLVKSQLGGLSKLQNITDTLGLTNNAGKIRANVAAVEDERQYNSPTEQAARMQEAGLNPDILGLQGMESDSASTLAEGNPTGLETGDAVRLVADAGIGLFTNVEGLLNGVLGIRSSVLNQDALALRTMTEGGDKLVESAVDKLAGQFLNKQGELSSISLEELKQLSDDYIDAVIKKGDVDFVGDLVTSPRLRKALNNRIKQRLKGAKSKEQYYSAIKDAYDSFGSAKQSQANIKALEAFTDEQGNRINFYESIARVIFNSNLQQAMNDYQQALNDRDYLAEVDPTVAAQDENAQHQYSADYYNTLDGSQAAEVQNESNRVLKARLSYDAAVNKAKNGLMDISRNLMDSKDKWDKAAGIALGLAVPAFLGDIQLHVPSMPSISHTYQVDDSYNRNGGLQRSRGTSSWKFGR